MAKDKEVALVPIENYALMQYNMSELGEVIQDNLGGDGIKVHELDIVKTPSGGLTTWTVPTLDGEEDMKEIDGIIIHWTSPRAYWEKSLDETGGGTEPDCQSPDGTFGTKRADYVGEVGGSCADCPFSKYGTASKGGGQACKEARVLFILQENSILPMAVKLAPTSIKPIRQYFQRLAGHGVPFHAVRTRLLLEKAENSAGIKYAKVKPVLLDRLTAEEAVKTKSYREQMKPFLEQVRIDLNDESDMVSE